MLMELFTWLTGALTQSPEIAIGAAFVWGILSVVLSPCHIACIPLIVGFIDGQGNYIVAIVFFAIGMNLMGILPLPFMEGGSANPNIKRKGILAAFALGLIFGLALGPCTFAYMATMLGVVFSVASTKLAFAVAMLLAFGIGHCSVLVFAGTFTEAVQHYLHWTENSQGTVILKKICGALVFFGGIYLIALNWI